MQESVTGGWRVDELEAKTWMLNLSFHWIDTTLACVLMNGCACCDGTVSLSLTESSRIFTFHFTYLNKAGISLFEELGTLEGNQRTFNETIQLFLYPTWQINFWRPKCKKMFVERIRANVSAIVIKVSSRNEETSDLLFLSCCCVEENVECVCFCDAFHHFMLLQFLITHCNKSVFLESLTARQNKGHADNNCRL